jgi:hypothetical protein
MWLRRQPPQQGNPMTTPEKKTLVYDTVKRALAAHLPSHLASTAADAVVVLVEAGLLVDTERVYPTQDPKYSIRNNRLINAERNEDIPLDEPVFLLRARDWHGQDGVFRYMDTIRHAVGQGDVLPAHLEAVRRRLADFEQFRKDHPERMKQPDTDPLKSASGKVQNAGLSGHHMTEEEVAFVEQRNKRADAIRAVIDPSVVQQGDVRLRQQAPGPLTDEEMPD